MPELRSTTPLILASTSATRRALCASAGLSVSCIAPLVNEEALKAENGDLTPAALARFLAEAKAVEVSARHPHAIVIGGDQVCALDNRRFGNAHTREKALMQLMALQGKRHSQHSGWALAKAGMLIASGTATAQLSMRAWSEAQLVTYIEKEQPLHSAGSYYFEGLGRLLFAQVEGTQDVILGLALQPLLDALFAQGVIAF